MSNQNLLLRTFFMSVVVGTLAGVLFVAIQPLFGMETITSRHAQAYIAQGGYSDGLAIAIAWAVHTVVSIAYALVSFTIYSVSKAYWVSLFQIAFLGWISTLVATPANVIVIKTITTQSFPDLSLIPSLNGELGAKFWLHIIFFVLVVLTIHLVDYLRKLKGHGEYGSNSTP